MAEDSDFYCEREHLCVALHQDANDTLDENKKTKKMKKRPLLFDDAIQGDPAAWRL